MQEWIEMFINFKKKHPNIIISTRIRKNELRKIHLGSVHAMRLLVGKTLKNEILFLQSQLKWGKNPYRRPIDLSVNRNALNLSLRYGLQWFIIQTAEARSSSYSGVSGVSPKLLLLLLPERNYTASARSKYIYTSILNCRILFVSQLDG